VNTLALIKNTFFLLFVLNGCSHVSTADKSLSNKHQKLAAEFAKDKLYPQAITQYQNALSLDPKNPGIYNGLSHVHSEMGNFLQAKNYASKALKINNNAYNHYQLARIHLKEKQKSKALKHAREAMRLNKANNFADLYFLSSKIFLEYQKYQLAHKYLNKALKINPKSCPYKNYQTKILYRLKQNFNAYQEARLNAKNCPLYPQAHFWLAFLSSIQGQKGKAIASLKHIKERFSDAAVYSESKKYILFLRNKIKLPEPREHF